jgi:hypothetical protein
MKHFNNRKFSLFNHMCDILFEFYEKMVLEHMCALEAQISGNYKLKTKKNGWKDLQCFR